MVDIIVNALADLISHALEVIVTILMPVFSFTFDTFNGVFPFAAKAYVVFQNIALGIALLLAVFQVFPLLFQSKQSTSTPIRILVFAAMAVFGIYYGNYILEWIMDIAQMPYDALLKMYAADNSWDDFASGFTLSPLTLTIETLTLGASIGPSVLLYIVLLLMVGIAFIKLLLEAVERYVILYVLVYLSPLASCTLASESTSGIFKKYFSMFISQCILLILNIWCMEMSISMFANLGAVNPAVGLIMGYAFMRIAAKLDSYLNQLGLNSAITGAGLGGELMATGMMLMSKFSPSGAGGSTGGSGGSGGVLGFSEKVADGIKRYTPTGPLQDAVGGLYKSVGKGIAAGKEASSQAEGGYLDKLRAGGEAAFSTGTNGFSDSLREAQKEGARTNVWSRSIYNGDTENPGMDILGQESISPNDLDDIAVSPYLGDDIMSNLDENTVIDDPATVAATMQSIGIDKQFADGNEAIAVGYGNTQADGVAFSADGNGIHAQYEKDGKVHEMDIKTASQYAQLTPQEQQAYTGYRNREGTQYYYKSESYKADTPYQKEQSAATASYQAAVTDPLGTVLTPESLNHMKRTPGGLNGYIDSFQDGNIPQQQAIDTWKSIQPDGSVRNGYSQGLDALSRGEATMTRIDGVTQLSWNDPSTGEAHAFSVGTQPFGETTVPMKQSDGTILYGSYQAPPTVQEKASQGFTTALSKPRETPLTPDSVNYMRKTPGALGNYINSFDDGPIPQQQATDTWTSIQAGGALSTPYNHGLDMLSRGNATMERNHDVTTLQWSDTRSGERHSFSVGTNPIGEQSIPMKQRDGSVLFASYQAPPSQEQRIMDSAKTFGSSAVTEPSISASDWAAAQNFRPAMKNQLMTDVYDSYASKDGSDTLPDTPQVREMVANRLDALDYRTLGLNQREVSQFSSKLRSGEAHVIHESARGTQVEYKEGNSHKSFTLVTDHAMTGVGPEVPDKKNAYSAEFLGNKGYSIKNVGKGRYYAAHVEDLPADQLSRKATRVSLGKMNDFPQENK